MIQMKLFTGCYKGEGATRRFIEPDEEVNEFLETNDVRYVDAKFNVSVDNGGDSWNSILLVYDEN